LDAILYTTLHRLIGRKSFSFSGFCIFGISTTIFFIPPLRHQSSIYEIVIPGFKDKIGYTPYVSLESQITHMATN
jgi:hypothetical protein